MPGERGDQGWCQVKYSSKIEIWTSPMWIEIFVLPATQFNSWNPRYTVYIYIYYSIYCKILQAKHKHSGTGVRIFVTKTNPKRNQTLVDSAPKTCHPASSHEMTICFYAVRKHPPRPQNASASTLYFWQAKHPSAQWSLLWAACCSRVSIIFSVSMLRIRLRISYRSAGVLWGFSHHSWVSSTCPHWYGTCAIVS